MEHEKYGSQLHLAQFLGTQNGYSLQSCYIGTSVEDLLIFSYSFKIFGLKITVGHSDLYYTVK